MTAKDKNNPFDKLKPLAERIRPKSFGQMVGQKEMLDANGPFMTSIQNNHLFSMILWGPPGVGKTTIAGIIAKQLNLPFVSISAVTSGVKELRLILADASKMFSFRQKKTILFIDEIHRFSKSQQDALLHAVEEGYVILIGATTENPSFEVIAPLLSRCKVYLLKHLDEDEIRELITRALETDVDLRSKKIETEEDVFKAIYYFSGGDARKALNILEQAVIFASEGNDKAVKLTKEIVEKVVSGTVPYYDKTGENHYDIISAFIKSVRGSDPDAALFWLAKMLQSGEKPEFIARRLIILAAEDIGNAEPFALTLANSAFDAVHKIGMPEARIILGQITTYLASLPKSNAAYLAMSRAMEKARQYAVTEVPLHLRNAPTKLMKEKDYGKGYLYPHDYQNGFIEQNYWPVNMKPQKFYYPKPIGKEKNILERLMNFWKKVKDKNEIY